MSTPVEILKAARELIAKPERWTRGVAARDQYGEEVCAEDSSATCWCAVGALTNVADDCLDTIPAENELLKHIPGAGFISAFNDSHDHAEVLALFDAAIASAQQVAA